MKIMVTGGAGFIGSHIVDHYIALGHEVVILDDLSTGQNRFINKNAKFYRINIRDRQKINEIMRLEKVQILNHHAAQMDVRKSVTNPQYDAEVNILGFLNLLEAGKDQGLKQVIFASSGGTVYGDTDILPTPESAPTHPVSPYGISKLAAENYLYFYHLTYGINYTVLRYGNVYGPRQNPYGEAGVVAIFAKNLLAGNKTVINGDGEQARDLVYVDDVVAANELVLSTSEPLTVNIGTGMATKVNEVAEILVKLTTAMRVPEHGPEKFGEQRISVLDATLAKEILGWNPKTRLEEGLRQTVAYFQNDQQ